MPAPSPDAQDEGFITPVFAGVGFAMVVVAAAFLIAARQDLASARTTSAHQAEQVRLEGRAAAAALRLLQAPDQSWQTWAEGVGDRIVVEPEGRKINPLFADRPDNLAVAARLVGPAHAEETAKGLVELVSSSPDLVRRGQIAAVSQDPRWRACAASAFSAYSQQTALALEPDLAAPGHVGEIWRVLATGPNGAFVDQVVRFSSDRARPVDILQQSAGATGGATMATCRTLINLAKD